MPEDEGAPRFLAELRPALAALDLPRRKVTFLLGSDEHIRYETRVALIPRHLAALGEALAAAGLEPDLRMLAGAGERAGYRDGDYAAAGARILQRADLARLEGLDVLHALKEPTEYESEVPGPFLRLGALHLASFPPGVCRMLERKNFAAIFDGGTVGSCSYLLDGCDRTPIVAAMSRFAGSVAGLKLVEGLEANGLAAGKIVVVGGGVAGLAAIDKIGPKLAKLIVVEPYAPTQKRLPAELERRAIADYEIRPALDDEALDGAVGIVFAHRSGAKAAEKVCTDRQIRRMKTGAAVVDIAIDQGGSILHDGYSEDDDAATSRDKYRALLEGFYYYAETNMPREVPREASERHGDASWVYVATLLALSAMCGGPCGAVAELRRRPARFLKAAEEVGELCLFECLVQDLRNGLQLAVDRHGVQITDPEVEENAHLAEWVRGCAGLT